MTIDDPFAPADSDGDGDRTLIRPMPGGRRSSSGASPPAPPRPAGPPPAETAPLSPAVGLNPLKAAAAPLLSLIMRLKNTASHPEPERLRQRMIAGDHDR